MARLQLGPWNGKGSVMSRAIRSGIIAALLLPSAAVFAAGAGNEEERAIARESYADAYLSHLRGSPPAVARTPSARPAPPAKEGRYAAVYVSHLAGKPAGFRMVSAKAGASVGEQRVYAEVYLSRLAGAPPNALKGETGAASAEPDDPTR